MHKMRVATIRKKRKARQKTKIRALPVAGERILLQATRAPLQPMCQKPTRNSKAKISRKQPFKMRQFCQSMSQISRMALLREISQKVIKLVAGERRRIIRKLRGISLAIPNIKHPPKMFSVPLRTAHKVLAIRINITEYREDNMYR